MRFAMTYPILSHPCDPGLASGAGVGAVAAGAEAAGFHALGFTDHPAPTQRWLDAGGHDALDPFVAMGFAAARTTTLRLIPNIVVLPYRNPFLVAKAGATLDRLSDGRFTLAIGTGYMKREFAALGVDFDERKELVDEGLEVIRAIWTGDDVSYDGKHFSARGITAHPRPISAPHPPIWIGGNTGGARARVVKHGDGWCPFAAPPVLAQTAGTTSMDSVEALRHGVEDLRRRCDAAGRDWSTLDISFTNFAGGSPGEPGFDADAYLDGLEKLAALGVTWVQVPLPGAGVEPLLEELDRFRAAVIDVYK
ncbi:LLM class F420-dependent oxidoreductase [Nocardia bovistercoris]|uniref:LLM class F420-dependent oxidoreductase n=1 Tax=Nocardia bovistercoris TaxID=2785916 RepID=A0A931IHB1_9NOCA|nr:LLM class F420-dependent oxidoreductase [Nocardia bovistercoris]MBH0779628.1 LLM class F420-dependent oxidoreductase [Nocardia bovistercoris]